MNECLNCHVSPQSWRALLGLIVLVFSIVGAIRKVAIYVRNARTQRATNDLLQRQRTALHDLGLWAGKPDAAPDPVSKAKLEARIAYANKQTDRIKTVYRTSLPPIVPRAFPPPKPGEYVSNSGGIWFWNGRQFLYHGPDGDGQYKYQPSDGCCNSPLYQDEQHPSRNPLNEPPEL